MKNKLIVITAAIFASTAIIAMELPDYLATELKNAKDSAEKHLEHLYSSSWQRNQDWIQSRCTSIQRSFEVIKLPKPQANSKHSNETNTISNEDMNELKRIFYTDLQIISQEKAKEHLKKYITDRDFFRPAGVVIMQNKICRDSIQAEDDECAAMDFILKAWLTNAITKEQNLLEKDISDKKKQQKELNEILSDMNGNKI